MNGRSASGRLNTSSSGHCRRRLLGNAETVGGAPGRGAGRAGEYPGAAQGVKSFLWLCTRHSGFAVCPAGDLAKGLEAAASGEAVSGGRRRASPTAPPRSHGAPLPRGREKSVPEQRVKRRRASVPKLKSQSSRGRELLTLRLEGT